MLQGMNITFKLTRKIKGADDEVGGATATETTIYTGIHGRLSALKPSEELRVQGVETDKLFNAVIQPVTLDIHEFDYLYPESGIYAGQQFKVTGVQVDSIVPSDPRAHKSLRLERIERARTRQ